MGGEKDLGTSLISSSSVLGQCIGALMAGRYITSGRRNSLINFGVLGIIGTAITLYPNIWIIILGRFIHGYSTGVFMTAGPRMLDECVPSHLIGSFGTYTNIYANIGLLLVLLLGFTLPNLKDMSEEDAANALANNNYWRLCYGLPIILLAIGIYMLLTKFKEESVVYLAS